MLKYKEHAELLRGGVVKDDPEYTTALSRIMGSYTKRKLWASLKVGEVAGSAKILEKNFSTEFKGRVVASDETFQKSLEQIGSSTPLKLPEDTEEEKAKKQKEKGAILFMVLKGTAKKYERGAAKADGKESASESEEAEDQEAESEANRPTSKETKIMTKKQMKKMLEEEAKGMIVHTGGIGDSYARLEEEFMGLCKKLDEEPGQMTYREVQALLGSRVWAVRGVDFGNLLSMHRPHGWANMKSKMNGAILNILKQKWETFKNNPNYKNVPEAIEVCKEAEAKAIGKNKKKK